MQIHFNNKQIKNNLLKGQFGLEKENIRIRYTFDDENINSENVDIDLDGLLEDNTDVTEINSNFFKL